MYNALQKSQTGTSPEGRGKRGPQKPKELLRVAAGVFSRGLVSRLCGLGHNLLEEGGDGIHLLDGSGRRVIDCIAGAGACNLGRRNRVLLEELVRASRSVDQGNFVMLSEQKAALAHRLASFVPGNLNCSLFTVVRGEAMDAACKLARGATGRPGLVTVDGGCYGGTGFALTLSANGNKGLFGDLIPSTAAVPFGDIGAMRRAVTRKTAAVILEPIQAENGCRAAGAEYLRALRRLCDRRGTILILDETQTGFGRTGRRFAFEHAGVHPDILVLGEAITGGMFPMTAMVFTPRLKRFFDAHPLIHLCTFGGHDLGCLVATKALELYEEHRPEQDAALLGPRLLEGLRNIARRHPAAVRSAAGAGLLASLELDGPEAALAFCRAAMKRGLAATPGAVAGGTVVLRPPLTVTLEDIDRILEVADAAAGDIDR
ncbi:MAG: aspartate aminotransferase family protein [Spirochaetes bacterium]|nr:aspartate aminotransferase family protein [Spirochaetota bacterium]